MSKLKVLSGLWQLPVSRLHHIVTQAFSPRQGAASRASATSLLLGLSERICTWTFPARRLPWGRRTALQASREEALLCGHRAGAEMPGRFVVDVWPHLLSSWGLARGAAEHCQSHCCAPPSPQTRTRRMTHDEPEMALSPG